MKNLHLIPKITRLARGLGLSATYEFMGNGITVCYESNGEEIRRTYSDVDSGIRQEIERLERLSQIQI
jgi:hypothetical protein